MLEVEGTSKIPSGERVSTLLHRLFGKPVDYSYSKPVKTVPWLRIGVAVYCYEDDTIAFLGLADLNFSSRAGSALTLIPANVADQAIIQQKLSNHMFRNLYEVFNSLGVLLNDQQKEPVYLKALHLGSRMDLPDSLRELVKTNQSNVDLDLHISGYGDGRLTIMAA
tara:strand:- start:238 stop:735 length:498 start_codon:yes stop_codon:yes gene_type:complete